MRQAAVSRSTVHALVSDVELEYADSLKGVPQRRGSVPLGVQPGDLCRGHDALSIKRLGRAWI